MKKFVYILVGLLTVVILGATIGLTRAHLAMSKEMPLLPALATIQSTATDGPGPVRISYINTATQPMPRSAVVDPNRDPNPTAPYVMSHPSFVLEWADGRILLVDAGMTGEKAEQFGKPIQYLGGGNAIRPLGSVAEKLGNASERVRGIVFTHLHEDHVEGVTALCEGRTAPIEVFMSPAQDERPNYLTRPGRELVRHAECLSVKQLPVGTLVQLPGFPGVFVTAAGGHTPGSQIITARVGLPGQETTYAFTGDIVNNIDAIDGNIPKPFLYRTIVVPEAEQRLSELRLYLKQLRDAGGFRLLVAHDQLQIEASGISLWKP